MAVCVAVSMATAVVAVFVSMRAADDATSCAARAVAADDPAVATVHFLHVAGVGDVCWSERTGHGLCGWSDKGKACTNGGGCNKCRDFHGYFLFPACLPHHREFRLEVVCRR